MPFINGRNSGKSFKVDFGANDIAILPTSADRQQLINNVTLQAVSRTSIETYGHRLLKLNTGLRRSPYFFVSDIPQPSLSARKKCYESPSFSQSERHDGQRKIRGTEKYIFDNHSLVRGVA